MPKTKKTSTFVQSLSSIFDFRHLGPLKEEREPHKHTWEALRVQAPSLKWERHGRGRKMMTGTQGRREGKRRKKGTSESAADVSQVS
jgi:hypothetical protein